MEDISMEKLEYEKQLTALQEPRIEGTTFFRTCLNGVNTLSGVGILSIPYAISKGGWLCVPLIVCVALLCFYTGILLRRCMDSDRRIKSYPDIAQVAFGRNGRLIVTLFLYMELFLVAVEFLIMEGDNLHNLFPKVGLNIYGMKIGGQKFFVFVAAVLVFPTTLLRSLGVLAYVSFFGVLSSLVLVLAVTWEGAFNGFHDGRRELWNWSGLPIAISLLTFCYCGHAVFPTLYDSMRHKSQFPFVLIICFVMATITYGWMGICGYLMYGEHLTSQVTLNLPTEKISSKIAIYTTLIFPITKYALIIAPIASSLEETFPILQSKKRSWIIRTCLVIATLIVAMVVPFFGYVMAFIGAFMGMSLSVLFPCLCYWKIIIGFNKFSLEAMKMLVILLIGSCVACVGTYTAISNIVINKLHHK